MAEKESVHSLDSILFGCGDPTTLRSGAFWDLQPHSDGRMLGADPGVARSGRLVPGFGPASTLRSAHGGQVEGTNSWQ